MVFFSLSLFFFDARTLSVCVCDSVSLSKYRPIMLAKINGSKMKVTKGSIYFVIACFLLKMHTHTHTEHMCEAKNRTIPDVIGQMYGIISIRVVGDRLVFFGVLLLLRLLELVSSV